MYLKEGRCMSADAHLAELLRRHHALDKEIEAEMTHSSFDDIRVAELKRKKLLLKDKIEKLKQPPSTVH